ncbi:MAG: sugar phosphate nucleotidyltransferase [Bryobacteraceae bacterium]
MKIKKGLITAAGDRSRGIPLQTLVDRDGATRTVLAMLVNEILSAGIEEICVIVPPGEQEAYQRAVLEHLGRIHFVEQRELSGYAAAVWCAKDFLAREPFLHLVGDHVYISTPGKSWAARLVEVAAAQECSVSAVQPTHESLISRFGVIGGSPVAGNSSLYKVDTVIEKPTPTQAEQRLIVAGLRAGYYLAFFGMHVFTPAVLGILEDQIQTEPARASVSGALDALGSRERYRAWQVSAHRYDLGPRYGLLNAQLALALSGRDRDEVLSSLVGLISAHDPGGKASAANE